MLSVARRADRGLAPIIVDAIIAAIGEVNRQGTAIVLLEQNFKVSQLLASDFHLVDSGRLTWRGDASRVDEARDLLIVGHS